MMVTHDVDEALFLSDRIICMTDGPEAGIGEVIEVNFPRPRERKAVMEHPDYYKLREQLIYFLEVRAHHRPSEQQETDDGGAIAYPRDPQPAAAGT